jgi:hypothetical protein
LGKRISKETFGFEEEDDGVDDLRDGLFGQVDDQIGLLRSFVRVICDERVRGDNMSIFPPSKAWP